MIFYPINSQLFHLEMEWTNFLVMLGMISTNIYKKSKEPSSEPLEVLI